MGLFYRLLFSAAAFVLTGAYVYLNLGRINLIQDIASVVVPTSLLAIIYMSVDSATRGEFFLSHIIYNFIIIVVMLVSWIFIFSWTGITQLLLGP